MHSLRIQVDPADSTYMPSVIVVSGGEMLSSLKEIVSVNISPTDRIVTLLSNLKEYLRYIEIAIKQCSRGGIGKYILKINNYSLGNVHSLCKALSGIL